MSKAVDTNGPALGVPEQRTLREVANRAEGPILDISPPDWHHSVEVLALATLEAGRHTPVISLGASTGEPQPQPPGHCVVSLRGEPATELRALPLRFSAVVVWAWPDAETALGEQLEALTGKLLPGAPLVALGFQRSHRVAHIVAASFGHLVVKERAGSALVFHPEGQLEDDQPDPPPAGSRRERSRRHDAARARRMRTRRRAADRAAEAESEVLAQNATHQPTVAVSRSADVAAEHEPLQSLERRLEETQTAHEGITEIVEDTRQRLRALEAELPAPQGPETQGAISQTADAPAEPEPPRALERRLDETESAQDALIETLLPNTHDRLPLAAEPARDRSDGLGGRPDVVHDRDAPITVVIAIHNAVDEVARCVNSVLEHTPEPHQILLIDDASTDSRIAPLLESFKQRSGQVRTVTNDTNRGYTNTINLGCDWAKGDVVLLNSDTAVASGWLHGLRGVARSRRNIATVTPISNAAGAFSVPELNVDTPLPEGVSVADMSALVARLSPRRRPEAPTGNGFCMYISRAALDHVGSFDADAFPRGYGEENDFCQRAISAGFINVIDDATFVYHQRSASFGPEKAELIENARHSLQERYPTYPARVRSFLAEDPLQDLRKSVATALRAGTAEVRRLPRARPTILVVLHSGGGGTPATTRDLFSALASTFRCLTLKCDVTSWSLSVAASNGESVEIGGFEFDDRWRTGAPLGDQRADAFRRLCQEERVALLHLRSLIATGPEVVTIAKDLGLPVVCSLHDFYTICPTIHLLDENEVFCGGRCTPGPGSCPTSKRWISPLPNLKHAYVYQWRDQMAQHLCRADTFVTTSEAARQVLVDNFEFMGDGRMRIIEHGRDFGDFRPTAVPPGDRPRVVAFGALGVSKGTRLLQSLLEIDQREGAAFEFHFLGARHKGFEPEALGAVTHGSYSRDDLPKRLAEIQPSYAIVASIWPETYCHTLTEAWMADLPVFASDIGTLRERIARHGGGWLLDYTNPEAFYAGMRRAASSAAEWSLKRREIDSIDHRTVDDMAADYRALYRGLIHARVASR